MQYNNLGAQSKKIRLAALFLAMSVLLCSCGRTTVVKEEKPSGADIVKQTPTKADQVHLRDKKLLYKNQDPTEVVIMYLTVSSGNDAENTNHTWEEINTYSVYDYERMGVDRYKVDGLLQVGDKNGIIPGELGYNQLSPNCTVQVRGQTSSKFAQKNYKISIKDNKGQWRGQSTIALNKHEQDSLRFRNKLAYDLIAGIDQMMGLRTTFVHLYVKDTTASGSGEFRDYGLYTQVEQLNRTALRTHGLDRNGHLYKINFFEFFRYEDTVKLKTDPTYDLKAFESLLEVKGNDDHSKLIKMLDELNDYSIPMDKTLEKYFDIENLSYWMAFHILIGNIDTQSRNVYIYSPLNSERWYFITWDNDGSLARTENKIRQRTVQIEWESGVSNYWGNVLFQRSLKTETFRKALDAAIKDLRSYLTTERINNMANTYASVVKPYVYRMPDSEHAPITSAEYDTVLRSIAGEIDTNYKLYKESLKKPMPFYIGTPQKLDDKLVVEWESSFDFSSETISYSFELSKNYTFSSTIEKKENLKIPTAEFAILPPGKYFMRVSATNESGLSQYAFDYYVTDNGKVYGTKCFYVDKNGRIVEDTYVEG